MPCCLPSWSLFVIAGIFGAILGLPNEAECGLLLHDVIEDDPMGMRATLGDGGGEIRANVVTGHVILKGH